MSIFSEWLDKAKNVISDTPNLKVGTWMLKAQNFGSGGEMHITHESGVEIWITPQEAYTMGKWLVKVCGARGDG